MLRRFALDETLHSTMARLRGKYTILVVKEMHSQIPDQDKIASLRKRGIEISIKMRFILSDSMEEKERATTEYRNELRNLNNLYDPEMA